MAYDASTRRRFDMVDAGARLTELEGIKTPTQYARGALAAVRMAVLSPEDRARVEALDRRWSTT